MKRSFQTLDLVSALANRFQESELYIQMQQGEQKIQGPINTVNRSKAMATESIGRELIA